MANVYSNNHATDCPSYLQEYEVVQKCAHSSYSSLLQPIYSNHSCNSLITCSDPGPVPETYLEEAGNLLYLLVNFC